MAGAGLTMNDWLKQRKYQPYTLFSTHLVLVFRFNADKCRKSTVRKVSCGKRHQVVQVAQRFIRQLWVKGKAILKQA